MSRVTIRSLNKQIDQLSDRVNPSPTADDFRAIHTRIDLITRLEREKNRPWKRLARFFLNATGWKK